MAESEKIKKKKATKITKKKINIFESICDHVNKEYLPFLNYFDREIKKSLLKTDIKTRAASSNGLWCCTLLPIVLLTYNFLYKVTPAYSLVAYISVGLLFYCILFTVFLSISCLVLQEPSYGGCIQSAMVSTLLLYTLLGKSLVVSVLYSLSAVVSCSTLLQLSLAKFPKTFTIGEAMIVVQSIVLFSVMTVSKMFYLDVSDEIDFIVGIVDTVFASTGVIIVALTVMKEDERDLQYLSKAFIAAALFGLIMSHCLLGIGWMPRAFIYILFDFKKLKLFAFWLVTLIVAIVILCIRTRMGIKANTVTRKSFHILASLVFASGILYHEGLMLLAAGVGLPLIVLVEALRKSGIDPVSSTLQSAFDVYSDEKDSGTFAMTPLYLYCGIACPLVLCPRPACTLELLSGVLAIGVGDTVASWLGLRYGQHKWTGTNKSMEGTAFNVLSQIITVYILQVFGILDEKNALARTLIAASISGVSEALTVQVDNLVLPLTMLIAFQITTPLNYLHI